MRLCHSARMASSLSRESPCRLNKCGVISPRYDIQHGQIEDWVARLLPSRLVRLRCIRQACGRAERHVSSGLSGVKASTPAASCRREQS